MRLVFDFAVALVLAAATGLSSAVFAVDRAPLFDSLRVGAWVAWPRAGGPDADPYDIAAAARHPDLPLGAAEGLAFTATTDDSGAPLTGACRYRLSGQTPPSRLWTLVAKDTNGAIMPNPDQRYGLHSRQILRQSDGSFVIDIAPSVEPGNWLPVVASSRFALTLTLYDTALTSSARPTTLAMPSIAKLGCP